RETYRPDFKRGSSVHCHTGGMVTAAEACAAPTSALIDLLASAADAPKYKGGAVVRNALPGFFKTWAKVAWGDLLVSLPEEADAALSADGAAAEEFARMVRDALLSEVVLGDVIGKA